MGPQHSCQRYYSLSNHNNCFLYMRPNIPLRFSTISKCLISFSGLIHTSIIFTIIGHLSITISILQCFYPTSTIESYPDRRVMDERKRPHSLGEIEWNTLLQKTGIGLSIQDTQKVTFHSYLPCYLYSFQGFLDRPYCEIGHLIRLILYSLASSIIDC